MPTNDTPRHANRTDRPSNQQRKEAAEQQAADTQASERGASSSAKSPAADGTYALPSISLPKGGGAVRGIGEKFGVNPATGTGSLSVPIASTPGRSGFGPQLALSYDSGAGNGPFGFGWSVGLPAVTRKTDKGLPRYDDAGESDVFILSGAEDLVPILDADGARVRIERTVHGVIYEVALYRPRIEGLFARIERWRALGSGITHWRSITRDNVTTLYGYDANSRIADPRDPRKIFSYLICRSFDDKGNVILYDYIAENETHVDRTKAHEANRTTADRTAQRYLKRVRYGNFLPWFPTWSESGSEPALPGSWHFELVLDYGDHALENPAPTADLLWPVRLDPFSSFRSGFEVRTYRRCRRILMFHHFASEAGVGNNRLARSTELRYSDEESPDDPANPIYTFLASVTHVAHRSDGQGGSISRSMPPVEFEYSRPEIQPEILSLGGESLENLPEGLDGSRYQWVDLDGEGLSGILTDMGGGWGYKRNMSPINKVILPDGGVATRARFGPLEQVASLPVPPDLNGPLRLMDLAGDGQLDAVLLDQQMQGFYERTADETWTPFKSFSSLPQINWSDPNLRLVDLTGDGLADALITDDGVFTFHPSLGEDGYGEAWRVATGWDEERGPRVVFADVTQGIFLADMSGDGLSDIVRARNGEICYWPNLGYGRFGAKVIMDDAPRFASDDLFDPKRVRLADIDGSGTTDVLYIGEDGVQLCFNRSGNAWGAAERIAVFPTADSLSSVQVFDLLGNGTACLVWSSPLPAHAHAPLMYVDLMGGSKPHLMTRSRNNLGAETRVRYAPSTKFYLADKLAGRPWITRMPSIVHVVERSEVYDFIGRSRFVSRYAYHHGYFDGHEREFRGFGMVEQWDTEEHRDDTDFPNAPATNWDAISWAPPMHTKTWFHTGAFIEAGNVSRQYASEYWAEPATRGDDPSAVAAREALLLPDTVMPQEALTPEELREAYRALKGSPLRIEVYSDDGTSRAEHPYTVTEQNFTVKRLQGRGTNRHAVFMAHSREAIHYHYERQGSDPRVTHDVTLLADDFGNVLESVTVAYGRRAGYATPEPDLSTSFHDMLAHDQTRLHIGGAEHRFTTPVNTPWTETAIDAYRGPLPSEAITAELTGIAPLAGRFTFAELATHWGTLWLDAMDIPYEQVAARDIDGTGAAAGTGRRIVERSRVYYRPNSMSGLLPLGTAESMALPGESYQLAFTAQIINRIYGSRVSAATLSEGGYVQLAGSTDWWAPSGRIYYSPGDADSATDERDYALDHFFLPRRAVDPFGAIAHIAFDGYDLLPVQATDPLGNVTSAANDYRVMQPYKLTDANGNTSEVAFDCLGMVAGSAVYGKGGEGDSLAGFVPDLSEAAILGVRSNPLSSPATLLGNATARMVVDILAYYRTRNNPTPDAPMVYSLTRETHVSDLAGGATRYQHLFAYSDGFGREAQKKAIAEPGPVPGVVGTVSPRWVGSGWTIFNNKGKAVRKYEPFFTTTHAFEFNRQAGVSSVLFYDPADRVVAVLHPDNTFEKTTFDTWRQETWDANDTVLIDDPRADADVGDYFTRLLGSDPAAFTSWHDFRIGGNYGATPEEKAANRDAAEKAELHAATPTVVHFDTLGRAALTVADNGVDAGVPQRYATRTALDAENKPLAVIDAQGRHAVEFCLRETSGGGFVYVAGYGISGVPLYQNGMDEGERRILQNVHGDTIRAWDARGFTFRMLYDALRRPTHRYVDRAGAGETLAERLIYGEKHSTSALNLKGRLFRHYDSGGCASFEQYDFKGNLLKSSRQLATHTPAMQSPPDVDRAPDWSPIAVITDTPTLNVAALDTAAQPLLDPNDLFTATSRFDALDRPIQMVTPHLAGGKPNVIQPLYNEASLLEAIDVWVRRSAAPTTLLAPLSADINAVLDVDYNARGERTAVMLGNGSETTYTYDPATFRLATLTTTRPNGNANATVVQALSYTYDPVGNVTRLRDDADIHNAIYFQNRRVDPTADYRYDAIYRLISATGREHLGLTGTPPALKPSAQTTNDDGGRMRIPHPGDGNAVGTYTELYTYDSVGNLLTMVHQVASGGWTRRYAYDETSLVAPAEKSNRLSTTSLPGDLPAGPYTATYRYDAHGNMNRMPHLPEMTWDTYNRLQSTTRQVVVTGTPETTYYNYDASGERIRKVTYRQAGAGVTPTKKSERIYLGPFEIYREYNVAGNTVMLERETLHVMDDRQRVLMVETRTVDVTGTDPAPAQMIRYQYGNHLGSATLELNENAGVITYEEYFPYGSTSYQAVQSVTDVPKRYRYTGKERDEENDLSYHGARYYAPWLGRWTACDPGGLVDGPNLYRYARNNPIALRDSNGRNPDGGQPDPKTFKDRSVNLNMNYDQQSGATTFQLSVNLKDPTTGSSYSFSTNNPREILQSLKENTGFAAALTDQEREGLITGIRGFLKNRAEQRDKRFSHGWESSTAGSVTWDAEQRSRYTLKIQEKSKAAVEAVEAARAKGDVGEARAAAKDASDFRNTERTATQKKLTPGGRKFSELVEKPSNFEGLEKKYANPDPFETYKKIATKSGESRGWVSKMGKGMKVLGPIATAVGVIASGHAIATATPEQRPRVIAEESGSFIGGFIGASLGTAAAGVILAALATTPVGWVAGAIVIGLTLLGGWLGGEAGRKAADEVYDAVQEAPPMDNGMHYSW